MKQQDPDQPEKQVKMSQCNAKLIKYSPSTTKPSSGAPKAPQRENLVGRGLYLISLVLYFLIVFRPGQGLSNRIPI